MLLASGDNYNLPWNVSVTEFLQFKGKKASKSQRIGIWIDEALEMFPVDWWRFFLMVTRPETKDSNFSWDSFREKINSDLNDTFGNFIHRTTKFITSKFESKIPEPKNLCLADKSILETIKTKVDSMSSDFEKLRLQSATNTLIALSRLGNQYLNENEPWNLIKTDKEKAANVFYVAAQIVKAIAIVTSPFMPNTSKKISWILNLSYDKKPPTWKDALIPLKAGHEINKPKPLFSKIDDNEDQLENKLKLIRQRNT